MKKEIQNDRLTVFLEDAKVVPEAELSAIPQKKRELVNDKAGVWIEVACPKGTCAVEKNKITLPAGGVIENETKGLWLSLFCPENQCHFYQGTDAP